MSSTPEVQTKRGVRPSRPATITLSRRELDHVEIALASAISLVEEALRRHLRLAEGLGLDTSAIFGTGREQISRFNDVLMKIREQRKNNYAGAI